MTREQEEKLIEFALRVLAEMEQAGLRSYAAHVFFKEGWQGNRPDVGPLPWVAAAIKELKP